MRMTLVYARIADKSVADEYFAVTEKVKRNSHREHVAVDGCARAYAAARVNKIYGGTREIIKEIISWL